MTKLKLSSVTFWDYFLDTPFFITNNTKACSEEAGLNQMGIFDLCSGLVYSVPLELL